MVQRKHYKSLFGKLGWLVAALPWLAAVSAGITTGPAEAVTSTQATDTPVIPGSPADSSRVFTHESHDRDGRASAVVPVRRLAGFKSA